MKPVRGLKAVLCAGLAACALTAFAPAFAQDSQPATREDLKARDKAIDARMDRFEKVLKSFREVLVQSKDTGKPVQVRLVEEPDPEVAALRQRLDDMEQAGRAQNGTIETLTHDLDESRREIAALKAHAKADAEDRARLIARVQALEAAAVPVERAPPPPAAAPDAVGPTAGYAEAKRLLLAEDYAGAAEAFQAFIEQNPDAPEAAEARYWLGETLYAQTAYADAATAYIGAIRGWPQTPWGPNAVVKLSRSLIALKKNPDACRTLGELPRHYPTPPAAVAARAKQARAEAKCG